MRVICKQRVLVRNAEDLNSGVIRREGKRDWGGGGKDLRGVYKKKEVNNEQQ